MGRDVLRVLALGRVKEEGDDPATKNTTQGINSVTKQRSTSS